MKYTTAELNKLSKLHARINDARDQLLRLARRRAKSGQASATALRRFRVKRARAMTILKTQERRLVLAAKAAVSPINKEIRATKSRRDAAQRAIGWVRSKRQRRANAEQQARGALPLTEKEQDLVIRRLKDHKIPIRNGKAIIFKRVSREFKTQENTRNETTYTIGTVVTVPNWNPRGACCGEGKLHACYTPMQCDRYAPCRAGEVYIAIKVDLKDFYAWPNASNHPTKIAFRSGKVLYRVNKYGHRIEADAPPIY